MLRINNLTAVQEKEGSSRWKFLLIVITSEVQLANSQVAELSYQLVCAINSLQFTQGAYAKHPPTVSTNTLLRMREPSVLANTNIQC